MARNDSCQGTAVGFSERCRLQPTRPPPMKTISSFLSLILCLALAGTALATDVDAEKTDNKNTQSEKAGKDDKTKAEKDKSKEELVDKVVVTNHTATIHDKEFKYTATVGKLVMKNDDGDA